MLTSTFLPLGLASLALAAPQYQDASHHSSSSSASQAESRNVQTVEPYDVHAYVNDNTYEWSAGKVTEYPVMFCNDSETAMIRQGLKEAEILAAHARDHIHRWGNSSSLYKKYFGMGATAEPAGWFDKIVNANKNGVIFRCDDPDGNCANNETWAGHWRGENGTDQTVICPPSYSTRWHLDEMCMHGWTVAGAEYNQYWASDLHHRLFHTIAIGEGIVDHFADEYDSSLELAMESPEEAARNTHGLALFALEAYAYEIAAPNQGCLGEPPAVEETEEAAAEVTSTTSSMAMSMTTSSMATAEATAEAAEAETETASAEEHCHTHSDTGEVHCS